MSDSNNLRIAILHPYLINQRGSERVLYALCELYPQADVFALVYDPASQPTIIQERKPRLSFVSKLPFANRYSGYQIYTVLYPLAVELFDLRGYDIVISNASGWMYGAITQPETCHICIMHGPFRFTWQYFHELIEGHSLVKKLMIGVLMSSLRQWDIDASRRVDYFVGCSRTTQDRIRKYYRRSSSVIAAPVDLTRFSIGQPKDYYLVVSALVPYKRVNIAVEACNILGWPLKIVGSGPELERLRKMAKPNVEFVTDASDSDVAQLYSNCRALLFTPKEDFGIVPLEAQASGRPVLAYRAGGALDTIQEGVTGEFFDVQTVESLVQALQIFQPEQYDPDVLREWATRFDMKTYKGKIADFVDQCRTDYQMNRTTAEAI